MKYQIAIDLTNVGEENIPLLQSQKFDTEEEANKWYRELHIDYINIDIIMIIWNGNKIEDTYIL